MSKQEEADLILKLYDLRREEVMRKARDWFAMEFVANSAEDIEKVVFSDKSGYYRMIVSYWEMACSLVNYGSIDPGLFADTNGEHIFVYGKIRKVLPELRTKFNQPTLLDGLEKVVLATPGIEARLAQVDDVIARITAARAQAASQSA